MNYPRAELLEGSIMVLVEPGVYEESTVVVHGRWCVTIWGCERPVAAPAASAFSAPNQVASLPDHDDGIQRVCWRTWNEGVLDLYNEGAFVSVFGMHMAALKAEGVECDDFYTVYAGGAATLSLERCDLTCQNGDAVYIQRLGTSATVSNCCIHNGNEGGVSICEKGKASLIGNVIHSNAEAGVKVQDAGSHAVIKGNHIHDGKGSGVTIEDNAKATVEGNGIHNNELAGVAVLSHSAAILVNNNIKGNGRPESGQSDLGFAGITASDHCVITMPPGSNTVKDNGNGVEQVHLDDTTEHRLAV
jgi:parallel beta-helix repeat protein